MAFLQDPLPPLSFEPLSPSPREIIVSDSDSDDQNEPRQRSAKRRRVEDIARQYVDGQPIYILSASLKGPFNGNWVNPWSKTPAPGATGSKLSRSTKRAKPKDDSSARVTPRTGAQGEHYPRRSNTTTQSVDKNDSRRDWAASKFGTVEEHKLDNRGAKADRSKKQNERYISHEPTRIGDEHDSMKVDYQGASGMVTESGFLKPENKRCGKNASTGTWLRTVKGSAYSHLLAQDDTASPSNELTHTPSSKNTYSELKSHTRPLDTSGQGVGVMSDNHSVKDVNQFTALDDPLKLGSEDPVPSSKSVNQRKTSEREEQLGCTAQELSTREEGNGVVIGLTDLVGASAETIQSWMRAKELSVLAASQASQAASLYQSNSPSVSRPFQSAAEAIEDADSVSQPAYTARTSLGRDDSKGNSFERHSHSQPDPSKRNLFEQDSPVVSFPARSSPTTSTRNSYRVVSPSTDLPGFKYWRAKSGVAPANVTHGGMANAAMKSENGGDTGSPKVIEPSFSTQAAVADMRRRFQADIETPAQQKVVTTANLHSPGNQPEQDVETVDRKPTIHSPLFVERSQGLHTPSADEATPSRLTPEKEAISTQMLLDAASPFEISTIVDDKRIPASFSSDTGHPGRNREAGRLASKNTSPEMPASTSRPGKQRTIGRADFPSGRNSAIKKTAVTSPGNTTSFISEMPTHSTARGEDDAVELKATIGEMMDSVLQSWDLETELRKNAGSKGLNRTGRSAGGRTAG